MEANGQCLSLGSYISNTSNKGENLMVGNDH